MYVSDNCISSGYTIKHLVSSVSIFVEEICILKAIRDNGI